MKKTTPDPPDPPFPTNNTCPFCNPDLPGIIQSSDLAVAIWDAFPASEGHALVMPRRHITSLHEATPMEHNALFSILREVRAQLQGQRRTDGFNIGINEGQAAGQTVPHLHIHLIPRYMGDVSAPAGGVRGVIPHKRSYKSIRE